MNSMEKWHESIRPRRDRDSSAHHHDHLNYEGRSNTKQRHGRHETDSMGDWRESMSRRRERDPAACHHRYEREPSGLRISEMMELRQDLHDRGAMHAHQRRAGRETAEMESRETAPPDEDGSSPLPSSSNSSLRPSDTSVSSSITEEICSVRKGSALKNLLRRSGSHVSSITGATKNKRYSPLQEEFDYGIDPTGSSFDLVIDPTSCSGSGRGSGTSGKDQKNRSSFTAADAVSVAAASVANDEASIDPTVATCDSKILSFWSLLSVRVAMTVMQSEGSEVVAENAANAVLEEGDKKHSTSDLRDLATKVCVVALNSGGDHRVAAAVAMTIMNHQMEANLEKGEMAFLEDAKKNKSSSTEDNESIPIEISEEWLQNQQGSGDLRSETSSCVSSQQQRLLKEKDDKIESLNRALEEASRLNKEKEEAINQRMRVLEAAAADTKRLAGERAAAERRKADEKRKAAERAAMERNAAQRAETEKMAAAVAAKAKEAELRALRERAEKTIAAATEEAEKKDVELRALSEKEAEVKRKTKSLEKWARLMSRAEEERCERTEEQRTIAMARSNGMTQDLDEIYASSSSQIGVIDYGTSKANVQYDLDEKEAEIAVRNKVLEEASRLNQQRKAEMLMRMEALDAATSAVTHDTWQHHTKLRENAHRIELKEREDHTAREHMEFDEAAQLSCKEEGGRCEQMEALSTAMARVGLQKRVGNMPCEIHGQDGIQSSNLLGQVKEKKEYFDQEGLQFENLGSLPKIESHLAYQEPNGEISVATPSRGSQGDHGSQDNKGCNNEHAQNHHDSTQQEPPPTSTSKSKGLFDKLTSKWYSIVDGACDGPRCAAPGTVCFSDSEEDILQNSVRENNSRTMLNLTDGSQAMFDKEQHTTVNFSHQADSRSHYSQKDVSPHNPQPNEDDEDGCKMKYQTLSAMTDDHQGWCYSEEEYSPSVVPISSNDMLNAASNQAMNKHMNASDSAPANDRNQDNEYQHPNQLLNLALAQAMNQQQQQNNVPHANSMPMGLYSAQHQRWQPSSHLSSPDHFLDDINRNAMNATRTSGTGLPANHTPAQVLNQLANRQVAGDSFAPVILTQNEKNTRHSGLPSVLKEPKHSAPLCKKSSNHASTGRVSRFKVRFLNSISDKRTNSPQIQSAEELARLQSPGSVTFRSQDSPQNQTTNMMSCPKKMRALQVSPKMVRSSYISSKKMRTQVTSQSNQLGQPPKSSKKGIPFLMSRKRGKLAKI